MGTFASPPSLPSPPPAPLGFVTRNTKYFFLEFPRGGKVYQMFKDKDIDRDVGKVRSLPPSPSLSLLLITKRINDKIIIDYVGGKKGSWERGKPMFIDSIIQGRWGPHVLSNPLIKSVKLPN